MLVKIGSYDICTGLLAGGVAVGQLRWQVARVIDQTLPVDQVNPVMFDRVTRKGTITFSVQRTFATENLAELFILDLEGNLPATGTIRITPTDSIDYQDYTNSNVISHRSTQNGATTTTEYTIAIGGPP